MQRIAIDMDDVMAETAQKIINIVNNANGTNWTKESVGKNHPEFNTHYLPHRDVLFEKGFFRDIPVMADAQEVIKKLHEKYEIFVVSAANEFPLSLSEKLEWLEEHFPFIGWKYTVFCGHKYMVKADYLIDDQPRNLATFEGKGLLFDAPHNQDITDFQRVHSWKEIEKLLL
ncbi:MAG: 5'-3'-deoxyribonucleotidase [Arcicella sp.]|jgi:5'(3')-deoxyribonucleotidase|nr:5'-3'-deoxyribonucleotidase [Arcicella sp.]